MPTDADLRAHIRTLVTDIAPFDDTEQSHQEITLSWIDSGAGLVRLEKPATPSPHLVSYFLPVDGPYVMLIDHLKSGLWLPPGGHVDPGEDPHTTATREAREELSIEAEFMRPAPQFLTVQDTTGSLVPHTDISFWYVLRGDRTLDYDFDRSEFSSYRWFHRDALPETRVEPHLARAAAKLRQTGLL